MVKKVQKTADFKKAAKTDATGPASGATPASLLDGQFAQLVKDSAQQIWSAGLAAFAKAQGNGGKVFDHLAAEGAKLQKTTQQAQASAEDKLGAVASRMTDMAGEVGTRAGQHWDKLESIFEDRVARALHRLGVPSAQDLAALSARLDALNAALASTGGPGAERSAGAVAAPIKRPGGASKARPSITVPSAEPEATRKVKAKDQAGKATKPAKASKAAKTAKASKPANPAKAAKTGKAAAAVKQPTAGGAHTSSTASASRSKAAAKAGGAGKPATSAKASPGTSATGRKSKAASVPTPATVPVRVAATKPSTAPAKSRARTKTA
ncbi:phasin family protein [Roseateles amylovorans]|uniref:phasin family protein n=1 Tax=Roseateles amylovorans TaxID=2978473 RepID=UPI00338F800C